MKLLVAVDLQGSAVETVSRALRFAEPLNATIDLLFADEFRHGADFLHDPALREMVLREWDDLRVRYATQLDMLMLKVPKYLRGTTFVQSGPPVQSVVRMAPHYDAIVVGTHGRQGISRIFSPSVTERIVRQSPVPVLVLHPETEMLAQKVA